MNLLLVDDDHLVLQKLKHILEERETEFDKVFMANCVEEAKKVLLQVPVAVMLCDIEMPGGSGLELLEWVRERDSDLQCIFLTNYADFSYAKEAIRLESLEYLLKPVEADKLCSALAQAAGRVQKNLQDVMARRYWLDTGKEAKDTFWEGCLSTDFHRKEDAYAHLGYEEQDRFLIVALKMDSIAAAEQLWGDDMLEYVLKNVLFETLHTPKLEAESVFYAQNGVWIAVCHFARESVPDMSEVEECLKGVVESCERRLHVEMTGAMGNVAAAAELKQEMQKLRGMLENVLGKKHEILHLEDYKPGTYQYQTPNISIWESLLKEKEEERLKGEIRQYVEQRTRQGWMKQQMQDFRQDFTQMIYFYLRSVDIQAHRLLSDGESEQLYQRACASVEDMCRYCEFVIHKVISYKQFTEETGSVMETILEYVDAHYCEEITREDLVNLVYISPDYCSRLFKKETGKTLSQYLVDKRIEKAKALLCSEISVKNVSLQVGYSNFSYFSKLFKEETGMTPMEYRERGKQ